ncbi:MAG: TIGR01459 family HAD-type hydrolase [Rhizobiaceae bacterium]
MNAATPTIPSLDDISGRYGALVCDVWGVLHNGLEAFAPAHEALSAARDRGLAVVLVTNAPRPAPDVVAQLRAIGIPDGSWDKIVTSGDVTRDLIAAGPRRVFHIGPERDLTIYEGLDVELCEEREASGVVCTGLFDDHAETPEHYAGMLRRLRARDLPFVCANPDIVVERGDQLIWCAGALARDYGQLGGRTLIAGKPFAPIYDAAVAALAEALGRPVDRREVLAIGDGILTDVKGAADFGLDLLYVSGGIHAREYGDAQGVDETRLMAFLSGHGHRPVATLPRLR